MDEPDCATTTDSDSDTSGSRSGLGASFMWSNLKVGSQWPSLLTAEMSILVQVQVDNRQCGTPNVHAGTEEDKEQLQSRWRQK